MEASNDSNFQFTPQQYQALLALIQHSDKNVLLEAQPLVTNQRSTSQTSSHSPIVGNFSTISCIVNTSLIKKKAFEKEF